MKPQTPTRVSLDVRSAEASFPPAGAGAISGAKPGAVLIWLALACVAVSLCAHRIAAESPAPWDGPAFSAPAAAVLNAAQAVPASPGAEVLILLEERHIVFDAGSRVNDSYRLVYRVLQAGAVGRWSVISVSWEPWRQQRPAIRARVITAEGQVRELDDKTIAEEPLGASGADIYSDRRLLRAPLPAVASGAIVETEIFVADTEPGFDSGVVRTMRVGGTQAVARTRITIEAPASLPLRYMTGLLPGVEPRRDEAGGQVRLRFDIPALEPVKQPAPYAPGDIAQWPYIAFTTGQSWQQIAARYSEIVDRQIAGADFSALLPAIVAAGQSPNQKATALLAWLQREVRYTGIEFAEASYVPRSPAETLQRKYGDCKDKAALLAALLRAAGLEAHLALLATGPGKDVEAGLPGFGGFNHAIVVVSGTPEMWIDPTDEHARVAELPIDSQGRLALIARPATTGLVRTPEAPSSDNRTVETVEVFLSEKGPGRIVETTETWGSVERGYRTAYAVAAPAELQKRMDEYAGIEYLSKKSVKYEHSDPRDLSRPFRLKLEVQESDRAPADGREALVAIPLAKFPDRLPPLFWTEDPAPDREPEAQAGDPVAPGATDPSRRIVDLELPEPFVRERRYRVVAPPGYRAKPLPESSREQLGPALFTREFAQEPDGSVSAIFRFDTGKRRLTPGEVEEMRVGLRRLEKAEVPLIQFEQAGEAHLSAGNIREALHEFRALVEGHPQEALHRLQIARAYLAAGAGEAARRLARQAVEIEPKSADAHRVLAYVLQHDLVGRYFGKGFDLSGAEAALRKAIELDPNDRESTVRLAILLEHDASGLRYGPRSRLNEAIALYEPIHEKLVSTPSANNLPVALMRAGRFAELYEVALTHPDETSRLVWRVVARTAQEGSAAGLREAASVPGGDEKRRSVLLSAGELLLQLRYYPEAADLFTAGARGSAEAASYLKRAQILRKLRRREHLTHDAADPSMVVRQYMALLYSDEFSTERIRPLFSRHVRKAFEDPTERTTLYAMARAARASVLRAGVPPEVAADSALSDVTMAVDGEPGVGYRVRVLPGSGFDQLFFVVTEEAQFRILGIGSAAGEIGKEILARVEAGDLAGARRWLDWVREEVALPGGDDLYAGRAFPRFWTRGSQGDAQAIRYAAAALLAFTDDGERAAGILREGRAQARADAERDKFDFALVQTLVQMDKFDEALPLVRRLQQGAPHSFALHRALLRCLAGLDRWKEAQSESEERLKRLPDDADTLKAAMIFAAQRGNFDRAQQWGRRLIVAGRADAVLHNNLAWYSLFQEKVGEEAVGLAEQAVQMTQAGEASHLHTLASLYAETGRLAEARELLLKGMEVLALEEPDSDYYYVFGRIAEQYGIIEAARSLYQKMEKPIGRVNADDSYVLGQRRLAALTPTRAN